MDIINAKKDMNNCFDHMNQLVSQNKYIHARLKGLLILPFIEIENAIDYAVTTIFNLPISIIKLPLSFIALTTDISSLKVFHTDLLPGISNVALSALKACVCFFNIIFAPALCLLSPTVCSKYHENYGLYTPSNLVLIPMKNHMNRKTFKDIVGMDELKRELKFAIDSFQSPEKFQGYDISRSNGIMFYGPPGCGKSFIAECLAGEINLPFKSLSVGNLNSRYMGGTVANIHSMFEETKRAGGGVIFIDEIDSLMNNRKSNEYSSNYATIENDKIISELLVQLEKASANKILVVGATNHLEKIDPATVRPGRFDFKIKIPTPDVTCLKGLLKHYLDRHKKLEPIDDKQYQQFAEKLEGLSISDVKIVARSAGLLAFKESQNVDSSHVDQAINQFLAAKKQQQPENLPKPQTTENLIAKFLEAVGNQSTSQKLPSA